MVNINLNGEVSDYCEGCWSVYKYQCIPLHPSIQETFIKRTFVLLVKGHSDPYKAMIIQTLADLPRLNLCPEFKTRVTKCRWAKLDPSRLARTGLNKGEVVDYSDPAGLAKVILENFWYDSITSEFETFSDLWRDVLSGFIEDPDIDFNVWETVAKHSQEFEFVKRTTDQLPAIIQSTIEWEQRALHTFQNLEKTHMGLTQVVPIVFQFLGPEFLNGQNHTFDKTLDPITRAHMTLKRYAQGWEEADRIQKRRRVERILPPPASLCPPPSANSIKINHDHIRQIQSAVEQEMVEVLKRAAAEALRARKATANATVIT